MVSQIVSVGENESDLGERGSFMDPNCAVEKSSVSMQSCEPFCTAEVGSFQSLMVAPDTLHSDVIVGALNNISIAESSGQKEDEKDIVGSDDVASDSKCHDSVCSSLRTRIGISSGSLMKIATGRPSRECKKISNKKMSPDLNFFELARRRRSCFSIKPRIYEWGSPESIGHDLKQLADADLNQNEHKKSRKTRGNEGDVKRKNNQRRTSSPRSKKEIPASTSHIRLKVTFGGSCPSDIMPGVVDDHKSSCGTHTKTPKYSIDIKKKFEEGIPSAPDGHDGISTQKELDLLEEAVDSRCLDPGTSPDSEVVNLIPESQTSEKIAEDDIINKQICVVPGEASSLSLITARSRKEKKKNKPCQDVDIIMDNKHPSLEIIDSTGVADQHGHLERPINDAFLSVASMSTTTGNITVRNSSSGVFLMEPLLQSSRVPDFGVSAKTLKIENGMGGGLYSPVGFQHESPKKFLPCTKPRDRENSRSSRSPKSRLECSQAKCSEGNSYGQKEDLFDLKTLQKSDCVQAFRSNEIFSDTGSHPFIDHGESRTGCSITPDVTYLKMNGVKNEHVLPRNAWVSCDNCYKWRRIPATLADSIEDTKSSWTCKDNVDKDFADCSIPQEKSNAEINAELDISDASCEEDAGATLYKANKLDKKESSVSKQSSWKLIRLNHFLHRTRKTQTIDEIMVCQCKASLGGRMGCRNGCLNRMLNIECVKGTCPCGELCSNNQFQKRKYAKLKCFRSGKKGYGLQLLEDIREGQFLIEYVGEVLDMHAYEDRQKEYALKGHKHFYFMTLNGSEVIDACAKGNLGRFINHSCEPNCRTEKWMVNGEVCVGLFALRDIKKGEEATFDYNYVRVFGAAARKCVCGSSLCRGFIGGDPLSGEFIVQDDSDEENLESVIVCEDSDDNLDNMVSPSSSVDVIDTCIVEKDVIGKDASVIEHLEATEHAPYNLSKQRKETDVLRTPAGYTAMSSSIEESTQNTSSADPELQSVVEMDGIVGLSASMQTIDTFMQLDDGKRKIISVALAESCVVEETSNKSLSTTQSSTTSTTKLSIPSFDNTDIRMKFKYDIKEDRNVISASHPITKTSHPPSSFKKGKSRKSDMLVKNPEIGNKLHQLPYKLKKLLNSSSSDPFEAVQVKLNELLDAVGGISKRKDASRGYLKLLFLTAASGDSVNGEGIQSNRDLSMILDALSKTKSRTVLADIIDKNGLQMLHNIMKRCRKEFHKIPILRKLLKVLEYLATREILTPEHITSGPRCAGVESFRESILSLTDHDDKQVHKIARNFRDKWIPRPIWKNSYMDRDTSRMDFHRGASNRNRLSALHSQSLDLGGRRHESIECIKQPISADKVVCKNMDSCSASCSSDCVANKTRVCKRKSRWDQPAESNLGIVAPSHKEPRIRPGSAQVLQSSPLYGTSGVPSNQAIIIYKENHTYRSVNHSPHRTNTKALDDNGQHIDEDVPPGFSSPPKRSLVSSSASSIVGRQEKCFSPEYPYEVVGGHPQERFISGLPISFGIPLHVVEQFGRPLDETGKNWVVAAGIPFHPYPPLPPYPRDRRGPTPASNSLTVKSAAVIGDGFQNRATYQSDQNTFSTSAATADLELLAPINQLNFLGTRGATNCLERKYFRQQKWSNTKLRPPWVRDRLGRGNLGNGSRNGTYCIGLGTGANELKGPSCSEQIHMGVGSTE